MSDLPLGEHAYYCGIDPGLKGAIGLMNAAGTSLKVWDLPVKVSRAGIQEFDLDEMGRIYRTLKMLPGCVVGIEWPTTRPGEGAERCERFGRGKGILQAFAHCHRLKYHLIAPNLWKGRLGLPGKDTPKANELGAAFFEAYYPADKGLIRGPRGGIRDGRMDSLLIAHFLRTKNAGGMRSIVETFGKDSPQALALVFGGGRRRKR